MCYLMTFIDTDQTVSSGSQNDPCQYVGVCPSGHYTTYFTRVSSVFEAENDNYCFSISKD